MRFLKFIFIVILAECFYSATLVFIINDQLTNHRGVSDIIIQNGTIDSNGIYNIGDIEWQYLNYGKGAKATLNLRALHDSCKITQLLSECLCTTFSIEKNSVAMGDTIKINIEMRGVEMGLQIRRLHIFTSDSDSKEPHSIRLIANVK